MISIIIPIFNRKSNLRRVLASLHRQDLKEFDVIVADDGSTDNPVEILQEFSEHLDIKYTWQPNKGFRANIVRNMGARLSTNDFYLFLDSDVMLNPASLTHYQNLTVANPTSIVVGRYDWLEPMDFSVDDVYSNWDKIISNQMPKIATATLKGIVGDDPRSLGASLFDDKVHTNYCLGMFGGNFLIPKELYWSIDGFDENMKGHGGEDCEFGIRLQQAGYKAIFTEKTRGYHIYHNRNQTRNSREVTKNIEYIKKKHLEFMKELGVIEGDIEKGELPLVQK